MESQNGIVNTSRDMWNGDNLSSSFPAIPISGLCALMIIYPVALKESGQHLRCFSFPKSESWGSSAVSRHDCNQSKLRPSSSTCPPEKVNCLE
jgi:hypothetical protein